MYLCGNFKKKKLLSLKIIIKKREKLDFNTKNMNVPSLPSTATTKI